MWWFFNFVFYLSFWRQSWSGFSASVFWQVAQLKRLYFGFFKTLFPFFFFFFTSLFPFFPFFSFFLFSLFFPHLKKKKKNSFTASTNINLNTIHLQMQPLKTLTLYLFFYKRALWIFVSMSFKNKSENIPQPYVHMFSAHASGLWAALQAVTPDTHTAVCLSGALMILQTFVLTLWFLFIHCWKCTSNIQKKK